MKGVLSSPGDYIHFQSQVPLHKIPVGSKQWRYYDFGPKAVPPLICIPGTAGTSDVHYKQIMALSMKGYRIISVDIPCVRSHHEWVKAFEKFLDALDVHRVHLYGTSLGGLLAQVFAQHRPRRVRSLVLSNTFLDTHGFAASKSWAPFVRWTPAFLLKRYVLTGIHDGPHEPFIADSVDFVVSQVETLSREDLAARLSLTVDAVSVGPLLLQDSFITIMDTKDYSTVSPKLKDQVSERYPGARQAYLKSGGDFPFLSRPDEVNLHLQLHLRRAGVEPRPESMKCVSEDHAITGPGGETCVGNVPDEPQKGAIETCVGNDSEEPEKGASGAECTLRRDYPNREDHDIEAVVGDDSQNIEVSEGPECQQEDSEIGFRNPLCEIQIEHSRGGVVHDLGCGHP